MNLRLSKKYGVNPSVIHCECCGNSYGVALLGANGGKEAPKDMIEGLCNDCQKVIDKGDCMFIEVRNGEKGNNPYRTGRIIGVSKDFKERNNIQSPIAYMEQSLFTQIFGNVAFSK